MHPSQFALRESLLDSGCICRLLRRHEDFPPATDRLLNYKNEDFIPKTGEIIQKLSRLQKRRYLSGGIDGCRSTGVICGDNLEIQHGTASIDVGA